MGETAACVEGQSVVKMVKMVKTDKAHTPD